jgi:multidrug efflux pump subunit AcrB
MTSGAMLVGMLPMALALGEGGEQTAPLGRAVLGGVLGSTVATLFILPLVFSWIQRQRTIVAASLDPDDPASRLYNPHS